MNLSNILETATAGIDERYFHLKIDGGPAVYRERVYCYELYHQLRRNWNRTDYVVNGEVDKSAHPIMAPLGARGRKPDLLIHGPGDMNANYAIIEVKPCNADIRGITKDLETLSFFIGKGQYQHGILLLYGYGACQTASRTIKASKTVEDLEQIELWIHKNPGSAAIRIATVGQRRH